MNADGLVHLALEPDEQVYVQSGGAEVALIGDRVGMPGEAPLVQEQVKEPTARTPGMSMSGECQRNVMSHEHLAALIAAHQNALTTHPEASATQERILSILQALASHEISQEQALRLLDLQALEVADEPALAALYRQAAADLRHLH
jgi:hypothetical protein